MNGKWIWISDNAEKDEYGEFFTRFTTLKNGKTVCRISCDGDYTLFINGNFIASNQYGDYEHYKIYDELDVSPYLHDGENSFAVLVWHTGVDTQRYCPAKAGLIFEIENNGTIILHSDENVLCRKSTTYKSGYQKFITGQLGYSFLYDATKEDGWLFGESIFKQSVVVDKNCTFYPRPNKKLSVRERAEVTVLKNEGNYLLLDLGRETVGLPVLDFASEVSQKIRVDWGEDLQNGHVRRLIDGRDFSFEYIAKPGKNKYVNYMLRLGGRYLEVYAEHPIELNYIGVLPQEYAVTTKKVKLSTLLDQKIYDVCVNTLRLCMMEHYVDTPWREQCLYVYDSRNQMLLGYYAFEDGNAEYAKSNLRLISKDRRSDGLLSICYPCGNDLTIPSFSLYYFLAVREYIEHTGDVAFGKEVYPKLLSVLESFVKNRKNGLVSRFQGANRWNFYDWSPYLDGVLHGTETPIPDLMINVLFILALENLRVIAEKTGENFVFKAMLDESKKATKNAFFNLKTGVFSHTAGGSEYTTLGNALAVLVGLTDKKESDFICEKIVRGDLTECSLSMKVFKFDVLLATDKEKYKDKVLNEIRTDYKKMLDADATSVWETQDGASAFDNAGSLCHGWSAIPVYYYHKLLLN